ncbi:MAG: AAA family ATPase [Bacteroidota bacterium]
MSTSQKTSEPVSTRQLPKSYQNKISTLSDLLDIAKNTEEPKKLFGDFIHENSLIHFPSERGSGKSFLMMQIGLAIVNCWDHFLGERINIYGNVLFVNAEMNEPIFAKRLEKLLENPPGLLKKTPHDFYTLTTRMSYQLFKTDLEQAIEKFNPKLIFLDNWTIAMRDNSGKKEDIANLMTELLDLKDKYSFSMVIADHTKKGVKSIVTDSDLQSGSGAKTDLSDQDFLLRKTKNQGERLLKRVKSRNAPEQNGAKLLRMNEQNLWFELIEDSVQEIDYLNMENKAEVTDEDRIRFATELQAEGKSLQVISDVVGLSKSTLHRKLKKE